MLAPQSRAVQQLAEVLATLASSSTEAAALQGGVERIAECFDSEVGAVVTDEAVVASVGFRHDSAVPGTLIGLAGGSGHTLEVPGAGTCWSVVVTVPSEPPSRLILARSGDEGYSLEEVSLLRSMARILANALDMLHLRDMVAGSEARFRGIVETANEGIWLIGVDASTTFANDKAAEILGYSPEEMAALSLFDVVDESGREKAAKNLERRRRGISDQFECAFVRKDGSHVWVLLSASPVVDNDGDFAGSLCMISDISHRKRIETASMLTQEALRETTARFRLLQAMATAANEASCLEEALQVAVDEICAHTGWVAGHAYLPGGDQGDSVVPLSIWHVDDAPGFSALRSAQAPATPVPATALVGQVLATRAPAWAGAMARKGGSELERAASGRGLATFAFPVCVGTEVTCILEFFSTTQTEPDALLLETISQVATQLSRVAERQRASNELATARDAAMESSRLKSDFLATMSHEIRTPMNGVIGLTGLLLSTDLDEQQRQYGEGVQSAGEALLAIINDILDFSKIEAGRLDLEVIDFDLLQVVEEAVGLVAQAAAHKGIELVTSCASGLPSSVQGDPARLRQVLLNLASNAVKFTSEGEVVVRVLLSEDLPDGVTVRFEVSDTGIGITEADGQRLFEPFSQADASTTRRFGGTGLGLAICRRLVAAMGGELGFDSVPGDGSTFWFTLPFQRQAGATPHRSPLRSVTFPMTPSPEKRGHVLVVEDNTSNQLVAVGILRLLGYRADVASDGVEALEALGRAHFDAILMDCQMPEMDGFTATGEIRRREGADRHTPVIAMTAGASDADRRRCLEAGMDDFLTKPVKPRDIDDALARWTGTRPVPGSPAVAVAAPADPDADPDAEEGRVLDDGVLEELRQLTPDGSLLLEVVDTYLVTAPDHVAELRAAVTQEDAGTVRQSAHRLRGESSALGAVEVARLCTLLEELAAGGGLDGAPALASAIEAAFGRATDELRDTIGPKPVNR